MTTKTKTKIGNANRGEKNGRYKHGDTGTKLHKRWKRIRYRAKNKKGYEHVKFCVRWNNYNNFKKDMEKSYLLHVKKHGDKNTTIDRIDNNKGYNPNNCRWATFKEQSVNRRNNVKIKVGNKLMTIPDAARKYNINYMTVRCRILKSNWPIMKALLTKPKKYE